MVDNMKNYDVVLESFSKPLMSLISNYHLSNEGILTVKQATRNYYQYIDYTHLVEYLFACIEKTLDSYFEKEIEFLVSYDKTKKNIQNIVDMPDKLIDLFVLFYKIMVY